MLITRYCLAAKVLVLFGLGVRRQKRSEEQAMDGTHEVRLCAQQPLAIHPDTRSWPQLLLKSGQVDTTTQLSWIRHSSICIVGFVSALVVG